MKKPSLVILVAVFCFLLSASWAQAHMLWLIPDKDAPQVNEAIQVEVCFGHKFPKDEELKEGRLGFIKAVGPDGQEVALKKISTATYAFTPPSAGAYLISAKLAPGFVTRTAQGMKMQTKKGLPDAKNCFHFDMGGKTIVNVGGQTQGFDRSSRSALEIVPLKNVNDLKIGETLPVRIIFQGKPLAGAEVTLTFETWADPKNPFALRGKTDDKGEFLVKLDKPGRWLLVASHKTPYDNQEECDENLFSTSLTWRVR
jgi:uncharacterized GH25 family protein